MMAQLYHTFSPISTPNFMALPKNIGRHRQQFKPGLRQGFFDRSGEFFGASLTGAVPTATFAAVPEVMSKPQLAGIGMAVLMMGQNMGMFIGPAAFGALVEAMGWVTAGYLLIPVAVVGIIAGWLVRVR